GHVQTGMSLRSFVRRPCPRPGGHCAAPSLVIPGLPMIAFDSAGRHLVLADDDELLVHDGASEAPRWRRCCKSPLVAVGAAADAVVSLDEDGQAIWHDPERDHQRAVADAGDLARAAAVSPTGSVLVA